MKGLLIYDNIGFNRNRWFTEELTKYAEQYGLPLKTIIAEKPQDVVDSCDFAIVRTINPDVNEALENRGVRCFNNAQTSKIANDKWKTYRFFQENHLPTMPTEYSADYVGEKAQYPKVVKSLDGHGGTEVFWAENEQAYKSIVSRLNHKAHVIQAPSSTLGVDMRLYVLGGKVLTSVIRTSDSDFRSNFSLGGKAALKAPDDFQLQCISKITEALRPDYIGIDFIVNDGKFVLNEIEDVVGSRMVYALTDINVAERYISYIKSALS